MENKTNVSKKEQVLGIQSIDNITGLFIIEFMKTCISLNTE